MTEQPKILVVDDTVLDLAVLSRELRRAGYDTATAADGEEAWARLVGAPDEFSAVLLDRVMPKLGGIELLTRIRARPELELLPVIFQTSSDSFEEVVEGLRAGACHYLTKPIKRQELLAALETAVTTHLHFRDLRSRYHHTTAALRLMTSAQFELRTLEEARRLAALLSVSCPDPARVCVGLTELLVNAIEHGNLGICHERKCALNEQDQWHAEVARLLALPENRRKRVRVDVLRYRTRTEFLIRDDGVGFDWTEYVNFSPKRLLDSQGRGIALATAAALDRVEYRGKGNKVLATVFMTREESCEGIPVPELDTAAER